MTLTLVVLPILGGCAKKEVAPKPTITTSGEGIEVSRTTIKPSGGVVVVDKPGDPLHGFRIEVPAGAYEDARTFKVSYKVVKSHTFGEYFHPISPLITVDNGGGYSEELMIIKIPVEIPDGHFAMAFFYHEEAGTLEGMPLIDLKQDSITVATRHFSDIIVSSIVHYLLPDEADSGFKPRVDDWQFTNYGSYIAPGGHCAGQSLTAMWYYYEKTLKGAPHLYGLYDNNGDFKTPKLWQDDTLGYKFASTIQEDMQWDSTYRKFFSRLDKLGDEFTWKAFIYAMIMTDEPQFVGVWETGNGGHAMIVYNVSNGRLYIADPNYPGKSDRTISFVNGNFEPYNSGANAEAIAQGNETAYDDIVYFAKSAIVDWDKITKRWGEFEKKTIGNDRFPSYTLMAFLEDSDVSCELQDDPGLLTNEKLIRIYASGESAVTWFTGVYREGEWMKPQDYQDGKIELKQGNNLLGILVVGRVSGDQEWVGFDWVNVHLEESLLKEMVWAEEDCTYLSPPGRKFLLGLTGSTRLGKNCLEGEWDGPGLFEGLFVTICSRPTHTLEELGKDLKDYYQKKMASRKTLPDYPSPTFTVKSDRVFVVFPAYKYKELRDSREYRGCIKYKNCLIEIIATGPAVEDYIEKQAKKLIDKKLAEMSRK